MAATTNARETTKSVSDNMRTGPRGHMFPKAIGLELATASRGEGMYIFDSTGKKYLDAVSGGVVASSLGHSHQGVIDAAKVQLETLPWVHGLSFTSDPAEELAELLTKDAPRDLEKVFFTCGGSEAVEVSAFLAIQHFYELGLSDKRLFISREGSFHGGTMVAMALGDLQTRRQSIERVAMDIPRIPPCYSYRNQRSDESEVDYGIRAANELEEEILRQGPENVAAFFAETITGMVTGILVPSEGYFKRIREICDKYDVLMILDEVQCGMGRTGALYTCDQEGVSPDMITLAKAIGGGYLPLGATIASNKIYESLRQGSRTTGAGHTFMAHSAACAAAVAAQKAYVDEGLIDNVSRLGVRLEELLHDRFGNHRHVGEIRGRGFLWGIELVEDRTTKAMFDKSTNLNGHIRNIAMESGLMLAAVPPMVGGHAVVVAPAYIATESQIEEIVSRVGDVVDSGLEAIGR